LEGGVDEGGSDVAQSLHKGVLTFVHRIEVPNNFRNMYVGNG